jgi:hypothetical protein
MTLSEVEWVTEFALRLFTEPVLNRKTRSFAPLRMTSREGFRVTTERVQNDNRRAQGDSRGGGFGRVGFQPTCIEPPA